MKKIVKDEQDSSPEAKKFPLPIYSEDEDIYSKEKVVELDEEGLEKASKVKAMTNQEGADLDVPGAELDDEEEAIGEEDEENNYYSVGGDDHHDLEEDKGG